MEYKLMKKKLLLISMLLPSASFAAQGFYASIGGNYSNLSVSGPLTITQLDMGTTQYNFNFSKHTGKVIPEIRAGYTFEMNNFVFGPMIAAQFNNISVNQTNSYTDSLTSATVTGQMGVKVKNELDADFMVGYQINNFLPYVFGGYTYANVQGNFTSSSNVSGTITQVASTIHKGLSGWNAGVGLRYNVDKNIFIGLMYRFARFNTSFDALHNGVIPDPYTSNLHYEANSKIIDRQFGINIGYNF